MRRLLQDHMCIGAAKPEGVDARQGRAVAGRPRLAAASAREGAASRSRFPGWADRSAGCRGCGDGESASAALISPAMPAPASRWPMFVFTEPIRQGSFAGPAVGQNPSQCPGLDRVAHRRAGAVGLDILDRRRADTRVAARLAEQVFLRLLARHRHAGGAAVLVHRGPADGRINAVAVGKRLRQWLEDDHAGPLAAHEAAGAGVERAAAALRREHAHPAEADVPVGQEQHVDAARQCQRAAVLPDAPAGQVNRHQCRRARRVDGRARSRGSQSNTRSGSRR